MISTLKEIYEKKNGRTNQYSWILTFFALKDLFLIYLHELLVFIIGVYTRSVTLIEHYVKSVNIYVF